MAVMLKSCDHGVVGLYLMFSFLILMIVFRLPNSLESCSFVKII